jgi:hypothetical protein
LEMSNWWYSSLLPCVPTRVNHIQYETCQLAVLC